MEGRHIPGDISSRPLGQCPPRTVIWEGKNRSLEEDKGRGRGALGAFFSLHSVMILTLNLKQRWTLSYPK